MSTRVVTRIVLGKSLVGFCILSSNEQIRGLRQVALDEALNIHKNIEPFDNVGYSEDTNNWYGMECGLSKIPTIEEVLKEKSEGKHTAYVLGKLEDNGKVVGFKFIDTEGNVFVKNILDAVDLVKNHNIVNVKLVERNGTEYIYGIKKEMRAFKLKKKEIDNKETDNKEENNKEVNKGIDSNDMKKTPNFKTKLEGYETVAKQYSLNGIVGVRSLLGAKKGENLEHLLRNYIGDFTKPYGEMKDKIVLLSLKYKTAFKEESDDTSVKDKVLIPEGTALKPEHEGQISLFDSVADKEKGKDMNKDEVKHVSDVDTMKNLVSELGKAAECYYNGVDSNMSDFEYDKKYDELCALEKKLGVVLPNSVTQKIGYDVVSKLGKVKHPSRMLSLEKTKDREELSNSLGGQQGFLSWKLDGLTAILSYDKGELVQAVTRGNGQVGEDVTHNAKFCSGVPLKIGYTDPLVVRGEALISYDTFNKINAKITKEEEKYKNPRNLASGSIRQLDSKVAKSRNIEVVAFTVVDGFNHLDTYTDKLEELRQYGFNVVDYVKVTKDTTVKAVENFEEKVKNYKYPTDGLVITIDNIAYGEMLGTTSKAPKNAKAFKWFDEVSETEMLDIEWSVGRTGAITPVAIFKPIDIDGSVVQRASVHNVSIFNNLKLGKGDKVGIYKANMIIPQISENFTQSGTFTPPTICPVCGCSVAIQKPNDAEVLMCVNQDCLAKHIGGFELFVSRDAMNIDGMAVATIEEFVNKGFIKTYKDFYHLSDHMDEIIKMEGFGKGSYNKIIKAIEKSRNCDMHAFIYSLGIPQMGRTTSKDVCRAMGYDLNKIMSATKEDFEGISGIGSKVSNSLVKYFKDNRGMVEDLISELTFNSVMAVNTSSPISGFTFCITGDVHIYKNRKELQTKIESLGGKAASSVSSKTNYLINNDTTSPSSKNQKAKQLGIPILSEEDFQSLIGE